MSEVVEERDGACLFRLMGCRASCAKDLLSITALRTSIAPMAAGPPRPLWFIHGRRPMIVEWRVSLVHHFEEGAYVISNFQPYASGG